MLSSARARAKLLPYDMIRRRLDTDDVQTGLEILPFKMTGEFLFVSFY